MSRLQSCHSCGAQFDVSSFAPGQQFTCGSCGAVLTAGGGAAPAASPARPAVSGRTPGSRKPAQGVQRGGGGRAPAQKTPTQATRGPQYRPPDRNGKRGGGQTKARRPASAAGRSAGGRSGGGRSRGGRAPREGYDRPREGRGFNPALLYGGGALVVAIVLGFLFLGGGGDDDGGTSGGSNTATASSGGGGQAAAVKEADTIASLKADLRETNLKRPADYRAMAQRFLKVGGAGGEEQARRLYTELIEQVDPDDREARKFLGYTDFQGDILEKFLDPGGDPISEAIANRRGYPFLDAVVTFNATRWLDDEDEIALAKRAVARMKKHEHLLLTDHKYRAGNGIRGNIANDPMLMDLNYASIWRPPYLICYSSSESLSDFDLLKITDRKKRREKRAEMAEKRKEWTQVLEEKAQIFKGTYDEWMKRYAEPFELKPLTDPYGGRPDYKVGVRSYEDGVPLCIWIFTDHKAFQEYHKKYKGQEMPPNVAGYFMPTTGWIFLFDDKATKSDRVFEIDKQVHEGVHQLEWWFTKQRSKWGKSTVGQNAISEGIAEYLGSVEMDEYRKLEFTEVEYFRLMTMQGKAKQFAERQKEYPIFPLKKLVGFTSYFEAQNWGMDAWELPRGVVMAMLYEQSWAFTYFVHTYKNGKYKESWLSHFSAVLQKETQHGMAEQVFKRAFKIRDDDDWDDLQAEWESFVKDDLLKRDWKQYQYDPPKRDDWPDDYPWPQDPLGD